MTEGRPDLRVLLPAPRRPARAGCPFPFLGASLFEDALLILLDAATWLLSRRPPYGGRIETRPANPE